MTKKKDPIPPPPSHRACALCGGRNLVEGPKTTLERGRGPEVFTTMVKCPGPKTWREVEDQKQGITRLTPPPLSGQDRAAGE